MPAQTTKTTNIYFPDGTEVAVKASGDVAWFDVGAILSGVTNTLEYTENEVITANAGKLQKQLKDFLMSGGFTLGNLDPVGLEKMGGGLFTKTETTTSPVTTNLTDQVIAGGWTDKQANNVVIINSSTNDNYVATALSLTSVTASVTGALVADDDYTLHPDPNSNSRFSISFNTAGTNGVSTTEDITIVFASVTPIESTVLYMGTTTTVLTAYALRFKHTDANGKIRQLELYSVDGTSGGFQFGFKGANEDGVEEMPLTYSAKIDTSLTDGRQLAAWTVEAGAA